MCDLGVPFLYFYVQFIFLKFVAEYLIFTDDCHLLIYD